MKRPFIYSVLISLVLITPFFYSNDLYNGLISAKQIWFYGAMALLILIFGIDLVFRKNNFSFNLNIIDIALLTFYAYYLIRTVTTPYIPMMYNERFLNWTLLIAMYFIIKRLSWSFNSHYNRMTAKPNDARSANDNINFFIINFLIITGLVEAVWGLLQLYGFKQSFNANFKITGSFFNPAPYALYLAVVFPLALGTLLTIKELRINNEEMMREAQMTFRIKNLKIFRISGILSSFSQFLIIHYSLLITYITYYISLLTVISIILVLPATMNRASWVGVAVGSLFVFNYRYNLLKRMREYMMTKTRRLAAMILLLVIFSGVGIGLYKLKSGSSRGRLFIWEVTTSMIRQHPAFGIGVGRFEAEYNNYQAEWFMAHPDKMDGPRGLVAGNTKYCFNEYLETAAELGIIGLLLFFALIISAFLVIKDVRSSIRPPNDTRSANDGRRPNAAKQMTINDNQNPFIPSLISFLVCSAISFPFWSLPTLILFFLLLIVISSYKYPLVSIALPSMVVKQFRLVLSVSLIVGSISLIYYSVSYYRGYYKFDEAVVLYQTGSYEESCKSFSETYERFKFNGPFLQY